MKQTEKLKAPLSQLSTDSSSTIRPPYRRSTEKISTWFPITSTPSSKYFSRPLDRDYTEHSISKEDSSSLQLQNIKEIIKRGTSFKEVKQNSTSLEKKKDVNEKPMLTLTQVSSLFEEFYPYIGYLRHRKISLSKIKRLFIKIIEKVYLMSR